MDIRALLRYMFVRRSRCRLGLSRTPTAEVYVLAAVPEKGGPDILWAGKGLPLHARFLAPPVVYADLGSAPVYVTAGELKNQDAEAWIDANEERIIPQGVEAGLVASEFFTSGKIIRSATVLKTVRDNAHYAAGKGRIVASLAVPLWNIARLYSERIDRSFILWRIASDGSVFGLVRDGRLEKLLNCHISGKDLVDDSKGSATVIEQYVNKLAQNDPEIPVVSYSPEPDFSLPGGFGLALYRLLKPPDIKGVPAYCHEAYANACLGGQEMSFLQSGDLHRARSIENMMQTLRSIMAIGTVVTLALLVLLIGADLCLRIVDSRYREPVEKLQTQAAIVKEAETRHRNLLKNFRDKIKFNTERSRVTALMSDLQAVFPENTWAEELSIALIGRDKYQCDIQAVTPESGLIGATLETFGKVAGMSDARLVSSEQIKLADGKRAMRFKMKSLWRSVGYPGEQAKP